MANDGLTVGRERALNASRTQRADRFRLLRRSAAALAVCVAAAAVTAVVARRTIAEHLLAAVAAEAGVGPLQARITAVDLDHLVAEQVRLVGDEAVMARRVDITYSPSSLIRRHVDAITVEGLDLALRVDHGGLNAGPLDSLLRSSGTSAGVAWSFGRIGILEAAVHVGGMLEASLTVNGTLTPQGDDLLAGDLEVRGTLAPPGFAVTPVAGPVAFLVSADGIEQATLTLTSERLAIPDVGDAEAHVSVIYVAGEALVRARLAAGDDTLAADALIIGAADDPSTVLAARAILDAGLHGVPLPGRAETLDFAGRMLLTVEPDTLRLGTDTAVTMAVAGGDTPFRLVIAAQDDPVLAVRRPGDGDSDDSATVHIAAGDLVSGGIATRIRDARASVAGTDPAKVTIETLRLRPHDPTLGDITVDVQGTVDVAADAITFAGSAFTGNGLAAARFTGSHDPTAGKGTADVRLRPLTFRPGGLQPGALHRPLRDLAKDVSGRVDANAHVAWQPAGEPTVSLRVEAKDVSFTSGGVKVAGLNTQVRFTRLQPPRTPPGQRLTVATVDAGLPLTDAEVAFQLDRRGHLQVEDVRFHYLGATVHADDVTIDTGGNHLSATFHVDGLDLDTLLRSMDIADIEAEGRLSGLLPVVVSGDAVTVIGGVLAADAPGVLRYRPHDGPSPLLGAGEGGRLAAEALDDFHYDVLRLELNGGGAHELTAGLHLEGANPAFQDGQPFHFNVNLSGDVEKTIRSILFVYALRETLSERILRARR